jgi:hypothetical protein
MKFPQRFVRPGLIGAAVVAGLLGVCMLAHCGTSSTARVAAPLALPGQIDPVIEKAMGTVCQGLPLTSAGGWNSKGTWLPFDSVSCGGKGATAGQGPGVSQAALAGMPSDTKLLMIPAIVASPGTVATFVVDFLNEDGMTRTVKWHVVPRDYFGTANGALDLYNTWTAAQVTGKRRMVFTGSSKSQGSEALNLELLVPPGTIIGGWSGQVAISNPAKVL